MKPIVIKPKSHDEWLKAREEGIGASEVAAVVGLSPWDSPFSLWLKKTHQVPPTGENQAMHLGHLLEPIVATLWEEETGGKVVKASAKDIIYQDAEKPWRRVTPDRIAYRISAWSGRKEKILLEIKTTATGFDAETIPDNYLAQCQYQMLVTGIHKCELAWLTSGRYFDHAAIEYDPEFAEWLGAEVDKFYNECVLGGREPDLISVADFVFKGSEPETKVEADEEALKDIEELRSVNERISELEGEQESLKERIQLFMGQNEGLVSPDGTLLATWKSGKRGRTFLLKKPKAE